MNKEKENQIIEKEYFLDVVEKTIAELFNGNLGLAVTYWVYGVLGGIVWGVGIFALDPHNQGGDFKNIVWFCFVAYYYVVYVGIWKAASKYSGDKVWAVLAKFAVIVVVLPTAIHFLKDFFENNF